VNIGTRLGFPALWVTVMPLAHHC